MFKKLWEKLSQPIIPPAKVNELDAKTSEIAAQTKAGFSKVVEGAKAAVAQIQVSGPNSTNIQAGGDLVASPGVRTLGAGQYVFYCRGIRCRWPRRFITPLDILKMQAVGGTVGDGDVLYYMPDEPYADSLAFAQLYSDRSEEIDLEDLPDMKDPRYGFGIVATKSNGNGTITATDV